MRVVERGQKRENGSHCERRNIQYNAQEGHNFEMLSTVGFGLVSLLVTCLSFNLAKCK